MPESRSPCGVNCAYTVEFEGLILNCTTTTRNETTDYRRGFNVPYCFGWREASDRPSGISRSFSTNVTRYLGYHDRWMMREVQLLRCRPSLTQYKIDVRYKSGISTFAYDTFSRTGLEDTFTSYVYPGQDRHDLTSRMMLNSTLDWSEATIRNLRSINMYAVLDTIVTLLLGNYDQYPVLVNGSQFTSTILNGIQLQWDPMQAGFSYYDSLNMHGT
jgi:hypothetical protein